jgi:hypothetical protein
MAAVCACCDVDLCEICGHGCECHHDHDEPHDHHGWELTHDLAS